jgi:hypothetical protein
VLIEGDLLVLNIGASGVALDPALGKVAWVSGKTAGTYAMSKPLSARGKTSSWPSAKAMAIPSGKRPARIPPKATVPH